MVAALWLCKKGMLGGMICLFEIVICIGRCSLKVCGEDSLMARLEHRLQPVVNYGIMPVFALANAGVALDFSRLFDGGMASVSLGIFLGLFVGKPLGIFLFSFLGIRLGLADKPEGITWRQLVAAGMLGGIGFTMSIFINNLAFTEEALVDVGKISILVTSVVAAVAGLVAMRLACKPFREYD